MTYFNEKTCRYALGRIFGFHPVTAHALLEAFGSAAAVFSLGYSGLVEALGAGHKDLDKINDREYEAAEKELREVEASGARFLCTNDPCFPSLLNECSDRPVGIYVRSDSPDEEIFNSGRRYISVVGTRDISPYGIEWCSRIVGAMCGSKERPVIVSGLALGTDITAHRKALDMGLSTIAVLPTGIDAVYPYRHNADARRIIRTPGCALITDYPPGTSPVPFNFLRRNRLIAGLSEATILIESKIKGGGMMTARLAFSYARDVYALPGRAEDIRSQGCNALIKEKIAEAIISEDSLMDSLGLSRAKGTARKKADREILTEKFSENCGPDDIDRLASVLLAIRQSRGADVEQISRICSLEYKKTAELVSLLECDGLITVDLMQRCHINHK